MNTQPLRFQWEARLRDAPARYRELLFIMATYGDAQGRDIRPSQETLARHLGADPRTVGRHIKAALQDGWLAKVQRGGRAGDGSVRATTYVLALPPQQDTQVSGRAEPQHDTQVSGRAPSTGHFGPLNPTFEASQPDTQVSDYQETKKTIPPTPQPVTVTRATPACQARGGEEEEMIPDLHELEHWLVSMKRPPALAADLYQYALDDRDTRVPVGRLTHPNPTYRQQALAAVLAKRAAATESELDRLRSSGPECEHGFANGLARHPKHDTYLCPACRAKARATESASSLRAVS